MLKYVAAVCVCDISNSEREEVRMKGCNELSATLHYLSRTSVSAIIQVTLDMKTVVSLCLTSSYSCEKPCRVMKFKEGVRTESQLALKMKCTI